jgi:hypothetical protein
MAALNTKHDTGPRSYSHNKQLAPDFLTTPATSTQTRGRVLYSLSGPAEDLWLCEQGPSYPWGISRTGSMIGTNTILHLHEEVSVYITDHLTYFGCSQRHPLVLTPDVAAESPVKTSWTGYQWIMPIILAIWKAKIKCIMPTWANILKDFISKITRAKWVRGVA